MTILARFRASEMPECARPTVRIFKSCRARWKPHRRRLRFLWMKWNSKWKKDSWMKYLKTRVVARQTEIPQISVGNQPKRADIPDVRSCAEPFPIGKNDANHNRSTSKMWRFDQFSGDSFPSCKTPNLSRWSDRQASIRMTKVHLETFLLDQLVPEWCQSDCDRNHSISGCRLDERIRGILIRLYPFLCSIKLPGTLNVELGIAVIKQKTRYCTCVPTLTDNFRLISFQSSATGSLEIKTHEIFNWHFFIENGHLGSKWFVRWTSHKW